MARPPPSPPHDQGRPFSFPYHFTMPDFSRPPPPIPQPQFRMPVPVWGVVYEDIHRRQAMVSYISSDISVSACFPNQQRFHIQSFPFN